jgi:hypothetical protein
MPLPLSKRRMLSSRSISIGRIGLALALTASAAAAMVSFASTVAAEESGCEHFAWSLKREQALFAAPEPRTVSSGTTLDMLPEKAIVLELKPNTAVSYVVQPARQAKSAESSGGIISISNVPKAGSYQVTTSANAWIDVIQNAKAVDSTAHTGQRDCAEIRKSVRFNQEPSRFSSAA